MQPALGSRVIPPFVRMARVHAAGVAGDGMIAVALAGSLFFSIDPDAARWRILLYLVFTMAPFAVVGPFIGPALDRVKGGRRAVVIGINVLRVITALLMIPNVYNFLLFPLAFFHLVLGKSYAVAKASIVPATVTSHDELVDKNSRLAVLSGLAGFAGAAPAAAIQFAGGPRATLLLAAATFALAAVLAQKLPQVNVPDHEEDLNENVPVGRSIMLAGSAMAVLRSITGFMFWMVAFAFRGGTDDVDLSGIGSATGAAVRTALGYPVVNESVTAAWKLGVVVALSAMGTLLGSVFAPRIRKQAAESDMLLAALTAIGVISILAIWIGGLYGAAFLALTIGFAASMAKVAFDSIVQRHAPERNHAAIFARFETRFQITWVLGAIVPVVVRIPPRLGFLVLAIVAVFAAVIYYFGTRGRAARSDLPAAAASVMERADRIASSEASASDRVRSWRARRKARRDAVSSDPPTPEQRQPAHANHGAGAPSFPKAPPSEPPA